MSPVEIGVLVGAVVFLAVCGLVAVALVAVGAKRRKQPGDAPASFLPFKQSTAAPVEHLSVDQLRKLRADEARKKEDAELAAIRQAEIDRLLGASAVAPKA